MGAFIPRISNRIDWRQLYAALEQLGGIPAASATEITGTRALFRAPFLDLAEVRKRIDAAGVGEPQQTVLYVDVLEIPGGFTWFSPDTTLSIYARRIEAAASARIRLDNRSGRNAANLLLFTNELPTPLTVVAVSAVSADIPVQITNPPPQGGLNIRTTAGAPARIDLTKAQGVPLTPPPAFVDMLRNSFIFASLLYDMEPDIALAKLIWIKEWGAASPVLLDFFLRSCPLVALLRAQIDAAKNGAVFVPYLTRHVYTTLATAFVAEAKRYESNYRLLAAQSVVTQNFIQQARALRDNQLSQTQYVDALAAQARTNYDNAVAAPDLRPCQIECRNGRDQFQVQGHSGMADTADHRRTDRTGVGHGYLRRRRRHYAGRQSGRRGGRGRVSSPGSERCRECGRNRGRCRHHGTAAGRCHGTAGGDHRGVTEDL
jgi:hypothetical protein